MDASDYKQQADIHAEAIKHRLELNNIEYSNLVNFVIAHKASYPRCFMRTTNGPIYHRIEKPTFDSTGNPIRHAFISSHWQADSDRHACSLCSDEDKVEFNWRYRRHHCRYCGQVVCAACSPHTGMLPDIHTLVEKKVRICNTCQPLYDELQGEMLFQHIKLYALFSALLTAAQSGNHLLMTLIRERQLFFNGNDFVQLLSHSLNLRCAALTILGLHPQVILDFNDNNILSSITSNLIDSEHKGDATCQSVIRGLACCEIELASKHHLVGELIQIDHQEFANTIQTLWQQNPHENHEIKQQLHTLLCLRVYWQCGMLYQTQPWPSLLAMQKGMSLSLMQNHLTDDVQNNFANIASEENTLALQHSCCQWLLAHPECQPNNWQDNAEEPWLWRFPRLLSENRHNDENLAVFEVVVARSDYDPNYHAAPINQFLLYRVLSAKLEYFCPVIYKDDIDVAISMTPDLPDVSLLTTLLTPFIDFELRGSYDGTRIKLALLLQKGVDVSSFRPNLSTVQDFPTFLQFMIAAIEFAQNKEKNSEADINQYPFLQRLSAKEKEKLLRPESLALFAAENSEAWHNIKQTYVSENCLVP